MNTEDIKRQIIAGEFAENNGRIIRTINILEGEYVGLDVVKRALTAINPADFQKSVVYLQRAGYIEIRDEFSKEMITAEKAKVVDAEATLTASGIKLALGFIKDEAVEI